MQTEKDLAEPLTRKSIEASPRRSVVQVYSVYGRQDVEVDLVSESEGEGQEVMRVIWSSVWINLLLFFGKLYVFLASDSLAVLASLVDSTIDLLGQAVLVWTKQLASRQRKDEYPVGRGKLEPVGVMICSIVMGMASIEVISTSLAKLIQFWGAADPPVAALTAVTLAILIGVVVLKGGLYVWCKRVAAKNHDDASVVAIMQDNLNDCLSNMVVVAAAQVTQMRGDLWFIDPAAAILISVYIIYTWVCTGLEQVEMIVGKRADPEFLLTIQDIAEQHDPRVELDTVCAYHFGTKYLVEIEVIMQESTLLRESHDVGIKLQHKVEALEDVQRCFVHIDYQRRAYDDHDPRVALSDKIYGGTVGTPPIAPRIPAV